MKMDGEELALIEATHLAPHDPAPLLAYAEWLGPDDLRSEYLRARADLCLAPGDRSGHSRLRAAAAKVDPAWLARLVGSAIENCPIRFVFPCPRRWEALAPTGDASVRHCDVCDRSVHFCATNDEARTHSREGRCVAVSWSLIGNESDPKSDLDSRLQPMAAVGEITVRLADKKTERKDPMRRSQDKRRR